jgi:hypothetical protein
VTTIDRAENAMETHFTLVFYSVHENLSKKKKNFFVCTTSSHTRLSSSQFGENTTGENLHILFMLILEYSHENL